MTVVMFMKRGEVSEVSHNTMSLLKAWCKQMIQRGSKRHGRCLSGPSTKAPLVTPKHMHTILLISNLVKTQDLWF